jgi:hypothetical protein
MNHDYIHTSLTRITDFKEHSFEVQKFEKRHWKTGDYVICKIIDPGSSKLTIELPSGRMRGIMGGELIIGVLGERFATLEATGTWKKVGDDGKLHVLTAAGLMGKLTSKSVFIPNLIEVKYMGHASRNNQKLTMEMFVKPVSPKQFTTPIVLIVGTSMSAGKTTSARIVTNQFKIAGLKVVGAKFTGAGRYKDILAIHDVGADVVIDFVDAGLPSSICSKKIYREKVAYLMNAVSHANADIAVIEIGASPLEPYNGDIAIEAIQEYVKCTILCASDPYAVYGIMKAYNFKPDIVTGVATNTIAGSQLVDKLCNVKALNIIDYRTIPTLKNILSSSLGFILN